MKKPRYKLIILFGLLGCLTGGNTTAQTTTQIKTPGVNVEESSVIEKYSDGLRKWTSQDSLKVRYIYYDAIQISPDGTQFFFATYYGDLSCDCNVYELSVFSTTDVREALARTGPAQSAPPRPSHTLIRRSAGRKVGAIAQAKWEPDGKSILFQGVSEQGITQLYVFDLRSKKVTALTNWTQEMYSINRVGDTIVTNAYLPDVQTSPVYPVEVITRREALRAIFPRGNNTRSATFVSYRGGTTWELKDSSFVPPFLPWFSVDGRKSVMIRRPKNPSLNWIAYDRLGEGSSSSRDLSQFILIDAENGRSIPVFDAPAFRSTSVGDERSRAVGVQALWAADQKHVVLINTALPLSPRHRERTRMSYVVSYNVDDGKWTEIEPLQAVDARGDLLKVTEVGWLERGLERGKELLIGHELAGKPAPGIVYTLQGDRWVGRTVPATLKLPPPQSFKPAELGDGLSVVVRQSANEPPIVVASDGKNELTLTSPDPALDGLWRARMEPFQWREPSGKMETGGLLLPRDAKGPVPLVIQAYTYEPDEFQPDGPTRHAYAAQSLVARGIAVLNVNIPESGTRETAIFKERVESAAEALAARGLIDPARVGLIGFSRGGFNVAHAVTHPGKYPPAAAVIDDAFSATYLSYLIRGVADANRVAVERPNGGVFWENKAAWLESEPTFNVDKVETPVLSTIHNMDAMYATIDWIGSFALNRRPQEYLVFPDADHQLKLPRQRFASQEATLDWMSFWLQGKIPVDKERAKRWLAMRTQQEAVLKEAVSKGHKRAPLPPLVPARQSSTTAVKQN